MRPSVMTSMPKAEEWFWKTTAMSSSIPTFRIAFESYVWTRPVDPSNPTAVPNSVWAKLGS